MDDDIDALLPLSPAILHILLALAAEERHGYGIMLEVARQSDGRYKLGPGTLYDNLEKLDEQGIVEETQKKLSVESGRRRYYRLTEFGRRVLLTETNRLEALVRQAKRYLKPQTGRAR